MNRNWQLTTQNAITSSASLRLYFSGAEFAVYAIADPLVVIGADAGITHYIGVNENCLETDDPAGQTWLSYFPVSQGLELRINSPSGTLWATANLGADGELYISGNGQVLPVELLSFGAERINEKEVLLRWSTATEHDNAGFEVWRMIDGEDDLRQVGWVEGAGDGQSLFNYELTDANATRRTSYYKLNQMDRDGHNEWSAIVAVAGMSGQPGIVAYPNPAHDQVTIQCGEPLEQVVVIDPMGSIVIDQAGANTINVSGYSPGLYVVVARTLEGRVFRERLIVQ
jgi:hypothetical protein